MTSNGGGGGVRPHLKDFDLPIPDELDNYESYPKITNYVAAVYLGVQFNLNALVLYLPSAGRRPSKFAAIAIKIFPTTCLLFSGGNMVITGGKTENGARLAAHTYRLMLESIPQSVYDRETGKFIQTTLEDYTSFSGFKIVNIVGSGKLFENEQVNLGELSRNNIGSTGWDDQIFPGLRYNIERNPETCPLKGSSKLMAHIFKGSNDVIMGAKVKEDIYIAHNFLKGVIANYLSSSSSSNTSQIPPSIDNNNNKSNKKTDSNNNINTLNNNKPQISNYEIVQNALSSVGIQETSSSSLSSLGSNVRKIRKKSSKKNGDSNDFEKDFMSYIGETINSFGLNHESGDGDVIMGENDLGFEDDNNLLGDLAREFML